MKRAFGTRKTSRALRFTATKLPLHTSVASASYRRRRCFIVIRGQIRTATHHLKPFKKNYQSKNIYKVIDVAKFWTDGDSQIYIVFCLDLTRCQLLDIIMLHSIFCTPLAKRRDEHMKKAIYINVCIRKTESRTLKISSKLIDSISSEYDVNEIDLTANPLEAIDCAHYQQRKSGNYSQLSIKYANDFAEADLIIIACPFWDMSFPSVFKIFCENISINGITFADNADGTTQGICKAQSIVLVTTRGMEIEDESPLDQASSYIKALCWLWGIPNYSVVSAIGMDTCSEEERERRIEIAIKKGLKICEEFGND